MITFNLLIIIHNLVHTFIHALLLTNLKIMSYLGRKGNSDVGALFIYLIQSHSDINPINNYVVYNDNDNATPSLAPRHPYVLLIVDQVLRFDNSDCI